MPVYNQPPIIKMVNVAKPGKIIVFFQMSQLSNIE